MEHLKVLCKLSKAVHFLRGTLSRAEGQYGNTSSCPEGMRQLSTVSVMFSLYSHLAGHLSVDMVETIQVNITFTDMILATQYMQCADRVNCTRH